MPRMPHLRLLGKGSNSHGIKPDQHNPEAVEPRVTRTAFNRHGGDARKRAVEVHLRLLSNGRLGVTYRRGGA